jgi:hypothetical protein
VRRSAVKRRKGRLRTRELRGGEVSIAGEADYIVARAMAGDARVVTIQPLVFFSTETGDAWLLDAEDSFALPLAAAGTRLPVTITETPARFAIEWPATFRIEGEVMVFVEKTGRVRTIIGYPTRGIAQALERARP